ncbi:DUF883 family protein [Devosia sp. FKR38]|uniref:DUF883 family protein n=1 Tax=Devosia sp. FKR38 TaxID=2562312 RepID=UPI0010C036E0|nr:DUF883 family protein [Devosia sp. FKR38]
MATTSDLAPSRRKAAASRASAKAREEQLEDQISQLQNDLKSIAATLSKLTGEKVTEARDVAKTELRHIQRQSQHVIDDVQDQASVVEKQIKDTIREKPLTAVAAAVGIGFILALLSR